MPKDEIEKCPDPRCNGGIIVCEGLRTTCMTCGGKGVGTEDDFARNKEEAEKLRREIFADVRAL